jgi:hypothetical protein
MLSWFSLERTKHEFVGFVLVDGIEANPIIVGDIFFEQFTYGFELGICFYV